MTREFIWQSLDTPGWEHVRMIEDHPEWTVFDSILVREQNGEVPRGGYTLVVDKQWRTLEVRFMLETEPGAMVAVHVLTEGDGRWTDADGRPMPELDGCLDISIPWSPLTHTLPLLRLALAEGQEVRIPVAHIAARDMAVRPEVVQYQWDEAGLTCIEGDVTTRLLPDKDGFVIEAADKFARTFPR